jgi:hypothetical protein
MPAIFWKKESQRENTIAKKNHMNLPSSGITWKDYRNLTPTFDLTPVEKPDFSPFLIHMTGKNSLVSILKGESAGDDLQIPENHGYLKAVIPVGDSRSYYNSEVVCFTESPIFALDFFRYRSFRRWNTDQQFGIGFSKSELLNMRDARPVIYLDTQTNRQLLALCNKIIDRQYKLINEEGEVLDYVELFQKIKPLLFPLLERTPIQGFMWEREWRCTDKQGVTFPYDAIKIICCPNNERAEIEEILGREYLSSIEIVESWREYDDVTEYLKKRRNLINDRVLANLENIKNLGTLTDLKYKNERTINTLNAYFEVFKETVNSLEGNNIHQTIEDLKNNSKKIEEQIKVVKEEIKKKEEQTKVDKGKSKKV